MHLLLVDDDVHVLRALRTWLVRAGHTVEAFGSVAAALAAFSSGGHAFDAALLDVNIGPGDGVALAGELRKLRPELPIGFATGSLESAERAAAHGPVLSKPCAPADLEALLASWAT